MGETRFVTSRDETRLRLVRAGSGEPVVLVHGVTGGRGDWLEVTRRLSSSFEVTAYDRRGRGGSDDGADYSIDREIEDVVAVIDHCESPVHLVGHSFGAIVCLLAAARARDRVSDLVVYEPPLGVGLIEPQWLEETESLIRRGDLDAAIARFAAVANITDDELSMLATVDQVWSSLRDGVRQAPREIRAAQSAIPIDERTIEAIDIPTLVLIGTRTDHPSYSAVPELADQLPSGRLARVPGRHLALVFAPDELASAIQMFIGGRT